MAGDVIVFAYKTPRYGSGTTLTHAAREGEDRTLCGKRITPEWMHDSEWADGPECARCRAIVPFAT